MAEAGPQTRTIDAPDSALVIGALPDPDFTYACQLVVEGTPGRSAEQWARAVFEGAPATVRRVIVAGWVAGLRLHLAPRRSPAHVLGWTVISRTPDTVLLATESPLLSARLVVQVTTTAVLHVTVLRYTNWFGRMAWSVAAPIHRLTIPYLLRHAWRHST